MRNLQADFKEKTYNIVKSNLCIGNEQYL